MLLLTIDVDILSNITLNKFKQFNFASLYFGLICVTNYSVFYCHGTVHAHCLGSFFALVHSLLSQKSYYNF